MANDEQAEFWSTLAPAWLEFEDRFDKVSELPGLLAMERLAPRAGESVLDVGCGSGRTTIELGRRVAPGGRVLGIDIAAEMLEQSAERARGEGVDNVDFLTADAEVHDLGESRFDGVFSRFGMMFFASPVAAFTNLRRSLRQGGRLSFVCWQTVFDNEWMLVPGAAAASVTGSLPPMPGPEEPGPFALADRDRLRSLLEAAGFSEIDVLAHNDETSFPVEEVHDVAVAATRVGAVRELLREESGDTRRAVLAAVEAALSERAKGGEVWLSRGVNVASATA